jgi:hypothetical protein
MRKRIIDQAAQYASTPNQPWLNQPWLNVESLAQVEVTSEDAAHPIEAALVPGAGPGWQAAQPGRQTVRLIFDEPQRIRRVHLLFEEDDQERRQEFVLRWSADHGKSYREIVRQQYNFSPPGTTRECEDYSVQLDDLTTLELSIIPDASGLPVRASLAELRLASR